MITNYSLNYGGIEIPFVSDFSGGKPVMVNATKMLECFPEKGKNNGINHFLRNQSTQDYIDALSADTGKPVSELLVVVKGGNDKNSQGTWMHKNLAIEFARWLNPEFSIWCNIKIKELLINRKTTLENNVTRLRQINDQLRQTYDQMLPYANYGYELLNNCKITFSTSRICKDFSCSISVQDVFTRLVNEGYVGKYANSKTWFLKAPYDTKGLTRLVSEIVYDSNGGPGKVINRTKWTEAGRMFLGSILLGWGVIPSAKNNP